MVLKLSSWNINGIRAASKKDGFKEWFFNNDSDIINFQEVRANTEDIPKKITSLEGYYKYYTVASRKGYSGVATFSKIKANAVYHGMGIDHLDSEGRILRLDFDDFILFNVYFPNGGSGPDKLAYKFEFFDEFFKILYDLRDQGFNIIVTGDVNIAHTELDIARPKQNEDSVGFLPEERARITKFLENGFVDTFRIFNSEGENYTWWSYRTRARARNVGWRLDYYFVNEELKDRVISSEIESDVLGSDHCPIYMEIDL